MESPARRWVFAEDDTGKNTADSGLLFGGENYLTPACQGQQPLETGDVERYSRDCQPTGFLVKSTHCAMSVTTFNSAPWVIATPFGVPVVPDVKIT